jgi:hypothetical protein
MITFAERIAQLKERYEKNPELLLRKTKLQEFIAKARAKAEAKQKAKLEAQAKLASMLKNKSEEE